MGEHSFDELARGLASGTLSRRKALRLMGAALVGSALASIPGVALAADEGGNRECVRFCKENFPLGPERSGCISAGARGEGPCFDNGGGGGGGCTPEGASCGDAEYCCCLELTPGNVTCICCPVGYMCGIDVETQTQVCFF
jgi:hypothetical protein